MEETLTHIEGLPLNPQGAGELRDGTHAAPSRRVPTQGSPWSFPVLSLAEEKLWVTQQAGSGCQTRAWTLSSARLTHAVQGEPGLAKDTVVLKCFIENH